MNNVRDVTIWEGDIGEWKEWRTIADNTISSFACGAELQVESYVGLSDDTAANGLRLVFCDVGNWNEQKTLQVFEGVWGLWKGPVLCPPNHFIDGAQVQYEDFISATDGTGVNGLRIHCSDDIQSGIGIWLNVHDGLFGSYRDAVEVTGGRVIGASVRYQNPCGTFCDDTALNGLRFRFQDAEIVDSSTQSPSVAPTRGLPTRAPSRSPTRELPTKSPSTIGTNSGAIAVAVSSAAVVLIILFGVFYCIFLLKRNKEDGKVSATNTDNAFVPEDDVEIAVNSHVNPNQPREGLNNDARNPPLVEVNHAVAESQAKPDFKDQFRDVPLATAVAVETNQLPSAWIDR